MLQDLTMAETDLSCADKFVHSLATRDFVGLGEAFAPEVQFRALVPPGLREARSRSDARNYYQQWFSDLQEFEMVGHTVIPVADHRTHVAYRLHFLQRGEPKVVEQRVFITLGDDGIKKFDLVCSGFLPRRG
jgi:hypothetical protein